MPYFDTAGWQKSHTYITKKETNTAALTEKYIICSFDNNGQALKVKQITANHHTAKQEHFKCNSLSCVYIPTSFDGILLFLLFPQLPSDTQFQSV